MCEDHANPRGLLPVKFDPTLWARISLIVGSSMTALRFIDNNYPVLKMRCVP
jgi:hypothetical protein